ncbi:unnamed protein product [Prunus armeniaca]
MSDIIRSCKAVTTASSLPPPATTSAATTPAQVHAIAVCPRVSHAPASSESSVAQPVSARRRHRPPSMTDTTSTSAAGASESQPAKKHTRGPCRQLKTAKVTRVINSRINIEYDERHRAAPTADQHSSLAHDIGHIVWTHCPMKWKSWKAMPDEVRITVRSNCRTLTTRCWHTSIDSLLRGISSGRATCTTIFRHMIISRLLFRRVARRSLRGWKIVGSGSAVIFRRPIFEAGQSK